MWTRDFRFAAFVIHQSHLIVNLTTHSLYMYVQEEKHQISFRSSLSASNQTDQGSFGMLTNSELVVETSHLFVYPAIGPEPQCD